MAGLDNLGHRNCVIKMPLAHNCSAELYLINSLVYAIEKNICCEINFLKARKKWAEI